MTACSAFGCLATSNHPGSEILCAKHWQLVPKSLRRGLTSAKRRDRREHNDRSLSRIWLAWRRCVDAANFEQFGIGAG